MVNNPWDNDDRLNDDDEVVEVEVDDVDVQYIRVFHWVMLLKVEYLNDDGDSIYLMVVEVKVVVHYIYDEILDHRDEVEGFSSDIHVLLEVEKRWKHRLYERKRSLDDVMMVHYHYYCQMNQTF